VDHEAVIPRELEVSTPGAADIAVAEPVGRDRLAAYLEPAGESGQAGSGPGDEDQPVLGIGGADLRGHLVPVDAGGDAPPRKRSEYSSVAVAAIFPLERSTRKMVPAYPPDVMPRALRTRAATIVHELRSCATPGAGCERELARRFWSSKRSVASAGASRRAAPVGHVTKVVCETAEAVYVLHCRQVDMPDLNLRGGTQNARES
jgi:hypothetical protein